jgi:hypothetical protein
MSNFELVFSLYGLLLGLALAEVLSGFGAAIQHRRKIRVGWLIPLLGLLVALDLTSFWMVAWSVRDLVPAHYVSLLGGLLIMGVYYLIARIAFPDDPGDWPDYDAYYFEHRQWVLGGIVLCNFIAIGALLALGAQPLEGAVNRWSLLIFVPCLGAAMFVRGKRLNAALLLLLNVQYPLVAVLGFAGVGGRA